MEHCCQCPQAVYPEAQTPKSLPVEQPGWAKPNASLFDLAPPGVCRATSVTRSAGGLLPHRFTIASVPLAKDASRIGRLFSVALSVSSPAKLARCLPVRKRAVPRSSDFPQELSLLRLPILPSKSEIGRAHV